MSSTAAFCLLSTLGGYLVTSFLLLKYPTLLHQRKKQRFLCRHISHRGGERGPQNPMAEMGVASLQEVEGGSIGEAEEGWAPVTGGLPQMSRPEGKKRVSCSSSGGSLPGARVAGLP